MPVVALLAFIAAASVLIVTPGPDTALVLRTAAVEGPRRGAYTSAGICMGLLVWGLAAALGVSAVLAASHAAYTALRAIGAAWLVWLGVTILFRCRPRTPVNGGTAERTDGAIAPAGVQVVVPGEGGGSDRAWFWRGLLSNATNPKVGVFFITFLPQFVPAGVAVAPWIVLLVAVHVALSVMWLGLLIGATRSIGHLLRRPAVSSALDRVTGAVLIGAGLRLAAEGGR